MSAYFPGYVQAPQYAEVKLILWVQIAPLSSNCFPCKSKLAPLTYIWKNSDIIKQKLLRGIIKVGKSNNNPLEDIHLQNIYPVTLGL